MHSLLKTVVTSLEDEDPDLNKCKASMMVTRNHLGLFIRDVSKGGHCKTVNIAVADNDDSHALAVSSSPPPACKTAP